MRFILFTLLTLLSCQTFSQAQEFILNNGLKIIVKEDHRSPAAVSMIWYNVGSADEPGGITGVSHALEHLMFKGTEKYPLGYFSKTISALGGQENAVTNNDYTAFFEKISALNLSKVFKLEADRMQHLLLDKEEFNKEMKVIREERRLRTDDNPQALAFERFLATAHLTAPYHHPVIGWMVDLKQLRVSDARAWYHHYYAPNNATLVVVGDVKAKEVLALAQKYFGPLQQRPQTVREPQIEPPALGKKMVTVRAPGQLPLLMLGFTVPSVKTTTPQTKTDPYALEIISNLLGAGNNGRLTTQLVRGQQNASDVEIFYNLYARYQTQFVLYGLPSQSNTIVKLKQGILSELNRLKTEPVSIKELQRIKTQIIAQKTFEKDSIFSQAMELGLLETVGLGWKTAETYENQINSITPLQLQKTALHYFQENNMTEALLIPTKPEGSHP